MLYRADGCDPGERAADMRKMIEVNCRVTAGTVTGSGKAAMVDKRVVARNAWPNPREEGGEIEQLPMPLILVPEDDAITTHSLFEISCENEAAAVYHTIDGSTPTANSTLYAAPFAPYQVGEVTIKAIAILEGFLDSEIAVETVTIVHPLSALDTLGAPIQPILHDDYYYLIYTKPGNNVIFAHIPIEIDYLLVGGGGGGGLTGITTNVGGGGGGGQIVLGSVALSTLVQHAVVVASPAARDNAGTSTALSTIIAMGGGKGGQNQLPGGNGASGGGGGGGFTSLPQPTGGTGAVHNNGGKGFFLSSNISRAGGGGGGYVSGAAYSDATSSLGGKGGAGASITDLFGVSGAELGLPFEHVGAGGGGGDRSIAYPVNGTGGSSVGGNGGNASISATNGLANSGSGGGGAGPVLTDGGFGGSGLCIIRWSKRA